MELMRERHIGRKTALAGHERRILEAGHRDAEKFCLVRTAAASGAHRCPRISSAAVRTALIIFS